MSAPLQPKPSFWWGVLGSVLPEIVRNYKIASGGADIDHLSVQYFVISILFMLGAGLFTVAWHPENELKAIWVGISFPVLVSAMLQATP